MPLAIPSHLPSYTVQTIRTVEKMSEKILGRIKCRYQNGVFLTFLYYYPIIFRKFAAYLLLLAKKTRSCAMI